MYSHIETETRFKLLRKAAVENFRRATWPVEMLMVLYNLNVEWQLTRGLGIEIAYINVIEIQIVQIMKTKAPRALKNLLHYHMQKPTKTEVSKL